MKREKEHSPHVAKGALALVAFVMCTKVLSAGFDCNRATSNVEKLICSNDQLSAKDEALNQQYREALEKAGDRTSLVNDQKAWIQERNKCVDSKCLLKAYENRLESLKSPASCPIQERDLIGHWMASNEQQDFEEMLFEIREKERLFFSWRHHHPEMPGIWKFQKCEIHIRHIDNPKLSFEYVVVKHSGRLLHLRELTGKEISTYKRQGN